MSDNISKLLASGQQGFLSYGTGYDVKANPVNSGAILSTQQEYSKIGFNYPNIRMFDPQNQVDKSLVHQQDNYLLEFKLDIEPNNIVTQFFFYIQYRNKNTDITKAIKHTSPMMNVENIIMQINNNSKYTISPEAIYFQNLIRISHGDKVIPELIDNLGLTSSYDIDPSTNSIAPGSISSWYFFAVPLFSNLNIPYNMLTNNSNQCLIKINLAANKFILPSSPGTYADLSLYDCKLVASQVFIPQTSYNNLIQNNKLDFRINDFQNSTIQQLDTTSLINDNK